MLYQIISIYQKKKIGMNKKFVTGLVKRLVTRVLLRARACERRRQVKPLQFQINELLFK